MKLPPLKRLFRFSLLTMLIVVTVLCVLLGLKVRQVKRQKEAIAWVKAMGGSVGYDYELADFGMPIDGEPGPEWLRELIGVDYVATIDYVDLSHTKVADLSQLAKLKDLETLCLGHTLVADLSPLAKLTKLDFLSLFSTEVSDLSPVANLTNLTAMHVSDTKVHDLTPLTNLTKLKQMDLGQTSISDVSPLVNLTELELLLLDHTGVTEAELDKLRRALPNCVICGDSDGIER